MSNDFLVYIHAYQVPGIRYQRYFEVQYYAPEYIAICFLRRPLHAFRRLLHSRSTQLTPVAYEYI